MAGFRSPLYILGLSVSARQAGFRTALPLFPAGGSAAVQAGFRTALPLFPAGGGIIGTIVVEDQTTHSRFLSQPAGEMGLRDRQVMYEINMVAIIRAIVEMINAQS